MYVQLEDLVLSAERYNNRLDVCRNIKSNKCMDHCFRCVLDVIALPPTEHTTCVNMQYIHITKISWEVYLS